MESGDISPSLQPKTKRAGQSCPEDTMRLNSLIPAVGRSIWLRSKAIESGIVPLRHRAMPSPLTREQTRLAVIEVLG